ncbi:MAG: hypothetical protein JNK48_22250 [Bryobacterales bacterium]|nr:hypothetical protein [Bryobacterales bacterium]
MGLLLAVIGNPEVEGTSLNGHVRNCPSKTQSWVRLSGLYAEVMFQARIAQDCSFSFTGLSGGEFLAYVIAHGRVVIAKQVKIVGQNPPLILEPATLPRR